MPPVCSVCASSLVAEIDQAMHAGDSLSSIARRYDVSRHALKRHGDAGHAGPVALAVAEPAQTAPQATVDRLEALITAGFRVLERSERKQSDGITIQAMRELRQQYELVAKLLGELRDRPEVQVNVLQLPEFRDHVIRVRQAVLEAAGPDVALAVAERLAAGVEGGATVPSGPAFPIPREAA